MVKAHLPIPSMRIGCRQLTSLKILGLLNTVVDDENVGLDHSIHEETATATLTRRLATSRDLVYFNCQAPSIQSTFVKAKHL